MPNKHYCQGPECHTKGQRTVGKSQPANLEDVMQVGPRIPIEVIMII